MLHLYPASRVAVATPNAGEDMTPSAPLMSNHKRDYRRRGFIQALAVVLIIAGACGAYWLSIRGPHDCRERMERRYTEGAYSLVPERAKDAAVVFCGRSKSPSEKWLSDISRL